MFVPLPRHAAGGLPACGPALHGRKPPPLARKAWPVPHTDQPPARRAAPLNQKPSLQFLRRSPPVEENLPAQLLEKFLPAAIPCRHRPASRLPAPAAPNVPAPRCACLLKRPSTVFLRRTSAKQPSYICMDIS